MLNKTVWDLVTRASVDIESSEGIGNKGCILLTDFGLRVGTYVKHVWQNYF